MKSMKFLSLLLPLILCSFVVLPQEDAHKKEERKTILSATPEDFENTEIIKDRSTPHPQKKDNKDSNDQALNSSNTLSKAKVFGALIGLGAGTTLGYMYSDTLCGMVAQGFGGAKQYCIDIGNNSKAMGLAGLVCGGCIGSVAGALGIIWYTLHDFRLPL